MTRAVFDLTRREMPRPDEIAARFATIVERTEALLVDDLDGWRVIVLDLHELTAELEAHVRRAELAVRRDTRDEAALVHRRQVQREIVPALRAGMGEIADVVLSKPTRVEAVARAAGERYVERLRVRSQLACGDAGARREIDDVVNDYTRLLGALRVNLDGHEAPFTAVRAMLNASDAKSRRAAFAARTRAVVEVEVQCDELLARAVHARRRLAESAGFDSFVELRYAELGRSDVTPTDVARFRSELLEHAGPLVQELRARQAAALGASDVADPALVHPADAAFHPAHAIEHVPAADELLIRVEHVLGEVAPELGEVVRHARADARVDLPARAGKAPGAYCATFPDSGTPFVLTNLVGIGRDAKVLVHEFGHAAQSALAAPIIPWDLRKPSLEACEVHSMALELLALPYMHHVFEDSGDERAYASMLVESGVTHALSCCALDAFQHELFAHDGAPHGPAERAQAWERHLRAFSPGIDHGADPEWARASWLTTRHLFLFPFYYVDYAVAQVVAWQLWLDAEVDREATVARYLHLCRRGGTASVRRLFDEAGIADPFDSGTISELVPRVRRAILEAG